MQKTLKILKEKKIWKHKMLKKSTMMHRKKPLRIRKNPLTPPKVIIGKQQLIPLNKRLMTVIMKSTPCHMLKEHVPQSLVLVINDNPYGLMFALSYICRTCL
jgi:hypothetical protein